MQSKAQQARRERRRIRRERLEQERERQRQQRMKLRATPRNEFLARARGGLILRFVKVGTSLEWNGKTPLEGSSSLATYMALCRATGLLEALSPEQDDDSP